MRFLPVVVLACLLVAGVVGYVAVTRNGPGVPSRSSSRETGRATAGPRSGLRGADDLERIESRLAAIESRLSGVESDIASALDGVPANRAERGGSGESPGADRRAASLEDRLSLVERRLSSLEATSGEAGPSLDASWITEPEPLLPGSSRDELMAAITGLEQDPVELLRDAWYEATAPRSAELHLELLERFPDDPLADVWLGDLADLIQNGRRELGIERSEVMSTFIERAEAVGTERWRIDLAIGQRGLVPSGEAREIYSRVADSPDVPSDGRIRAHALGIRSLIREKKSDEAKLAMEALLAAFPGSTAHPMVVNLRRHVDTR